MSHSDPHYQREQEKYQKPIASREHILTVLKELGGTANFKILTSKFDYSDREPIVALKRRLRAMEKDGQLIFNKAKQYEIVTNSEVISGRVIGHREGYGFLTPDGGGSDYFIPFFEMQQLLHGDHISARLNQGTDKKGRQEIRVIEVLTPRAGDIVGRFFVENQMAVVVPDDARICQDIIIPPDAKLGARHGQMVVVTITQRPSRQQHSVGKVVEVLGDHLAPGMEIQVAISQHNIPNQWPEAVDNEIADLAHEVEEKAKQGRVDLRQLPLVTIDGEDARDFDDAVYCEVKEKGGWTLWVAIADVSYYVRPNTALDQEAINRGNSVYFPGQVVPMLPEVLSNGLCSLNPNVDRLCMVSEMTISDKGKLTGSKFYPAVMCSKARLTYNKVAAIFDGDVRLREQYDSLIPHLDNLHALYQKLNAARNKRGAIAFETEESRFIFNAERKIDHIEQVERNVAHKIIEECMILANVATATFVTKHHKAGLFRVHDKPNEEKYRAFISYLAELGIEMPFREEPEPADYGVILEKVAGRADQELIQTMLLRSMKQAVYDSENIGHFGLALEAYSHFTSPIRRYPDLVIHRIIKAILNAKKVSEGNLGAKEYSPENLADLGLHCSMTERRADDATRSVADWLKCEYMQDHIGDEFEGVISTVTNFGLFVRLPELHIEGLVHITSLGNDYFTHDELRMRLVGERSGIIYHVGQTLRIKVAAVNLDDKKIDFILPDVEKKAPSKNSSTKKVLTKSSAKVQSAIEDNTGKFKKASKRGKSKAGSGVAKKKATKGNKRLGRNARKKAKQAAK